MNEHEKQTEFQPISWAHNSTRTPQRQTLARLWGIGAAFPMELRLW
jgi:hypothetical protein